MQKKSVFLPLFVAGTLFIGCSDKSDDSTSVVDPGTSTLEPESPYIDPNTGEYVNPETGETKPTVPYVDPETGETVPGIEVTDPNTGKIDTIPVNIPNQGGTTPTSSSANNGTDPQNPNLNPSTQSSSSGDILYLSSSSLKEYEDNHKAKETFLPKAGFYSSLTIEPPTPQKGGEIRCTFDGSFPTQASEQLTQAKQITENTVIRCSEFVNGQAADTTTQTYFIGENVSMPVVALTVNHHDMFDSTDGLYATGDLTSNPGMGMGFGVGGDDTNNPKCTEPCKQANFWKDDELPVHVEYFEKGSSTTEKHMNHLSYCQWAG